MTMAEQETRQQPDADAEPTPRAAELPGQNRRETGNEIRIAAQRAGREWQQPETD
ncbi:MULTISPECIES: hypothetical protein [unclassified Amycolatopsis]|uniref:hypothetical protein n=1 Tax=unclassified Amycolatopsis TaxID=2618356 RepID=UPI001C6A327E|nr:hypothetical protein [Amycolatopsis sp. DSM 110486]QYN19408.1 hypothetical protein K1T34_43450 [Amycolatopsis sp. DSM 110486]